MSSSTPKQAGTSVLAFPHKNGIYIYLMIIRICRKEASKRLNNNNTVQAERSAVTDSQHIGCVSERRDLAYVPIADNHYIYSLIKMAK